MFEINIISKSYKNKQILNNVSLRVNQGEAIGILGTNGSGKSTLLNCIAGEFADNRDFRVGYVPQDNPLFDELKPVDNLRLWTDKNKSQILKALSEPPLSDMNIIQFLDTPVKKMSGGMKKRLSIASVLINNPSVLLLDEPFAALDLVAKQDILSFMKNFLQSGGYIIVASHDEAIFDFCNHVYLLKNGSLIDTKSETNYLELLRN